MTEVLWHGRGGEGAFTAARLLGDAYILNREENFALAFSSFGPERRGAPIRAFTKLDRNTIGDRSEINKADYIIYLDDTLFSDSAFSDLKEDGKILINTKKNYNDSRIVTIDGDKIALDILKRPIVNTIMLGALAAHFREINIDNIANAIKENMAPKLHDKNIAAVEAAYREVTEGGNL